MFEHHHDWLVAAFSLSNSLRVLFYLPQIISVARSVNGARDVALSTWWMLAANNVLGAVYCGVAMQHLTLAVSFLLSGVACLAIIALALKARQRVQQRGNSLMKVA